MIFQIPIVGRKIAVFIALAPKFWCLGSNVLPLTIDLLRKRFSVTSLILIHSAENFLVWSVRTRLIESVGKRWAKKTSL